jgi:prepilin-type N-terminal cleavage/methylation domain-containing protein
MKLQKTKLGFTLIELLVVITIIGILATGAV